MKRPSSTILKKQADGAERERVGNKGPLFDIKIETATEGLIPCFSRTLHKLPSENALTMSSLGIAKTCLSSNSSGCGNIRRTLTN
jgi:hypothetical protein